MEVLKEAAQSDDITGRVYESFLAARADGAEWSRISEEGFWSIRRLPLRTLIEGFQRK